MSHKKENCAQMACDCPPFSHSQKESECCDANKKTSGQWHNENCFYRDITESTEKIVILYANLSGRESSNRAEFRVEVEKILCNLVSQREKEIAGEVERELKELEVRELSDEEIENEMSKIVPLFCSELSIKKALELAELGKNDFGRKMRNKTLKRALDKVLSILKQ